MCVFWHRISKRTRLFQTIINDSTFPAIILRKQLILILVQKLIIYIYNIIKAENNIRK